MKHRCTGRKAEKSTFYPYILLFLAYTAEMRLFIFICQQPEAGLIALKHDTHITVRVLVEHPSNNIWVVFLLDSLIYIGMVHLNKRNTLNH